jgi:hypothetical protein
MDRRKFLSTLVGGVASGAAVRTFPFRVFSFPKEISLVSGICDPIEVAIYWAPYGGEAKLIEQISLAEAKARYGYVWQPGYAKTQRAKSPYLAHVAPVDMSTTGLIEG